MRASPRDGTPRAVAISVTSSSVVSRRRSLEITTTAIPASRSCCRTSFGPIVVSVRTTVGASSRMASAFSVCPAWVTTGRSSVPVKVVDASRPTT